jgi:hypothetical protein
MFGLQTARHISTADIHSTFRNSCNLSRGSSDLKTLTPVKRNVCHFNSSFAVVKEKVYMKVAPQISLLLRRAYCTAF